MKSLSWKCHRTLLIRSQHWFRQWLGAVRQQAITWSNVDPELCHHMVSLGHIGLIYSGIVPRVSVNIGSGNGLSSNQHQAIIWTNANLLSIGPCGTNIIKTWMQIQNFINENAFENVVCKKMTIMSWPQCLLYLQGTVCFTDNTAP